MSPLPIDFPAKILYTGRGELHQIKQFAQLRVELDAIKALVDERADKATLQAKVDALNFEVPEYNGIVGLWGQNKARNGHRLIEKFCQTNDLVTPPRGDAIKQVYKCRLVDRLRVCQRGLKQPLWVNSRFYEEDLAFGVEFDGQLMDELVAEGVFICREDGLMALANWSDYRFDFNI